MSRTNLYTDDGFNNDLSLPCPPNLPERRVHEQTQTNFTNEDFQKMKEELDYLKNENKRLLEKKNRGGFFWISMTVGGIALCLLSLGLKGEETEHQELRLMLVGKTGAGKSASGNTILGEEAFRVEPSPSSLTKECMKKNKVMDGRNVTVIDSPGYMDTWNVSTGAHNAPGCISMAVPGPHVFLLVVKVGRFTQEEANAVKWIQENFGEVSLNFTIILFAGGDLLEDKPIHKFIMNSYELQNLVKTCHGRYHVFNNYNRSNRTQVTELFQKIDLMLQQNMGYMHTNEVLKKVQQRFREEGIKKQIEMNEMAMQLRDEQYENMRLRKKLNSCWFC